MAKKVLSSILAGVISLSMLSVSIFAEEAAKDIVLKPGEPTGLTKVSEPEKEVEFKKTDATKGFVVLGESDGKWLVGGDNGDIGISLETLKKYEAIEIDYTCDNPIKGTKIGFAFKVHVDMNSRTCEDGGYIFADYLPATWVPYGSGADGKQPIKAVNSLETIYKRSVKEEGTLSVNIADLLAIFPEDMDYMMGIGIGADNKNDSISEDDDGEEYTIVVKEIRFGKKTVTDEPEVEETDAPTEAPTEAPVETPSHSSDQTSSSNSEATKPDDKKDDSNGSNNTGIIIGVIIGVVVIAGGAAAAVIVKNKKK